MKRSALICLVLLAALGTAAAGDGDVVTLKEQAVVSGEYVCLGDVASVQGPDADDLAALNLMRSPGRGAGTTLSAQLVASKIQERLPGCRVSVQGAPGVRVTVSRVRVEGAELESLFRAAAAAGNPYQDVGTVEIGDVKTPPFVFVPEKDKGRLQANFAQGEDFLGVVTATISAGNGSRDVCRVTGKIKVMAKVPVAVRVIRRGELISEADFELKPCDISVSPLMVRDPKECLGMRAKTTLQAGKPLLRNNIAQPPLVSRGDMVAISARCDELVVMDRGIALKDGFLGDKIPIKNASSGRQVIGTIIAHSQVEVLF